MPMTTPIDMSTARRNGALLKESFTLSHVAGDPVHSKTQCRVVLPSNSPSSAFASREKRRQTTSQSPEPTESVNKEPKRRRLNEQSCSYCRKDKEKCSPLERSWPDAKCDRCIEKSLSCSEPQTNPSKLNGPKDRPHGVGSHPGTPSDDSGFDDDASQTVHPLAPVKRLTEAQKPYPTPSNSISSLDAPVKSASITDNSSAAWVSQSVGNSSRKSLPDVVTPVGQGSSGHSFVRPSADGVDRPELVCPVCQKPVKTQSELKKHDLRHRKPFICRFPGCPRTEGFSTTNDLDRHMRSKHQSGALATAPAKLYRCLVSGCKSSEKVWPRGDNFRSHLKRVHGHTISSDEEFEKLVHKGEFTPDPAMFARSDSIRSAQEDSQESEPPETFFPDSRRKESPAPLTAPQVLVKPSLDLNVSKKGSSNNAHVPKRPRPTGVTTETEWKKPDPASAILPQMVERLMARNEYSYKALLEDETRMLVLLPGEKDEIIQCRLLPLSTKAPKVSYEALSYCWGDIRTSKEIRIQCLKTQGPKRSLKDFVRAKRFIPANLHSALLHLRDSSFPIYLWVDNLCINMNDSRERAHQVSKMGRIYQQANNVCVWLGESDDSSKLALEFIPRILNLSSLDNEVRDGAKLNSWRALRDLMSRKWFSRRWVIQEIAFAKNSTIHCGDDIIHWADFADAVGLFVSRMNEIKQLPDQQRSGGYPAAGWSRFAERIVEYNQSLIQRSDNGGQFEPTFDLETLLWTFKDFDCTDARDRVNSLLALARDVPPLEYNNAGSISSLDYQADITDVIQRCVMHCVNVSKSLDIICRPWAPIDSKVLPSWIATVAGSAFGILEDGSFGRKNGDSLVGSPNRETYNASAGRSLMDLDFGQGILLVRGLNVDTIGACLPRASGGIVWREALHMAGWNEQSDKFYSVPEKLWRTLVADRSPDGSPPKSWYRRACLYTLAQTSSSGVLDTSVLIKSGGPSIMVEFLERVQSVVWNRKFFTTSTGKFFGLGPDGLQNGDVIAVLYGCSVPVVLRAAEHKMHYKLVGECYIHGLMDGQAVTDPNLRDELFHLV